jgi:DNA-binding transcriptional regulator YiaG
MSLTRSLKKLVQRRVTADAAFSRELIASLAEACEHAEGKSGRVRVHVVDVPDVRAIRRRLRMSQMEFARPSEPGGCL